MSSAAFRKRLAAAGEKLIDAGVAKEVDYQNLQRIKQQIPKALDKDDIHKIEHDVRKRVQTAFQPWFYMCDPQGFDLAIDRMRDCAARLSRHTGVHGATLVSANVQLSDISDIQDELAKFNGEAIDAFQRKYASRIPTATDGLCSVATFLGSVLVAEKRLFQAAERDLLDTMKQATDAMNKREGGGDPFRVLLKVAGAIAGAAAVFVSGGSAAVVGVGAGAALLGSLDSLLPDDSDSKGASAPIQAERWYGVMEDVERILTRLSDAMERREKALDDACVNANRYVHAHTDVYDLSTPTSVLHTTSAERLGLDRDASGIHQDVRTLRHIGSVVMRNLSNQYLHASSLAHGSIDEHAWSRNARIGLASHGAYSGWRALNDVLRKLCDDTKWEIVKAGEHLAIAADLMHETDEQIQRDLARHAKKVAGGSAASHHHYAND